MRTEGGTKKTKTAATELEPGTPEFKAALGEATERMGQINGRLRKTAADQVEIGLLLRELHQTLPHKWKARIYSDSDDPLLGIEPLDITQADGEQLIRIAKNGALSDSRNSEKLPWARSTLDVLAKVPAEILQGAIDRGEVTRKLKCDGAEQLIRKLMGQPEVPNTEKGSEDWAFEKERERLASRIFSSVEAWLLACPFGTPHPSDPKITMETYPEWLLRDIAKHLAEGRTRRAQLTEAGLSFLADAKRRLEELGHQKAAEGGRYGHSLTAIALDNRITDLVGQSSNVRLVLHAIDRVIEGRMTAGELERALLEKALKAEPAATAKKKAKPAPKNKPKAGR